MKSPSSHLQVGFFGGFPFSDAPVGDGELLASVFGTRLGMRVDLLIKIPEVHTQGPLDSPEARLRSHLDYCLAYSPKDP